MDGGDDDKRVEPADIIDLSRKSREFGEVGSLPISSPSLQLLWWETLGKPWETLATLGPIPRHVERAEAVARFRLTSGHDFSGVYLLAANEACPLCGHARIDVDHLLQCTGLDEYPTDDMVSWYWGKILGEPTPLATNRKKRQARTRWRQAKPTMAARKYIGIRWMRNENICKQYRN
ncbi:reverse transcriptase [Trichonephila clavipes]|nr:reverse transcriptase [Trichonephila clavipes]